jgi:hypothetical protein
MPCDARLANILASDASSNSGLAGCAIGGAREDHHRLAHQRRVIVTLYCRDRNPPTRAKASCGNVNAATATEYSTAITALDRSSPTIGTRGLRNRLTKGTNVSMAKKRTRMRKFHG